MAVQNADFFWLNDCYVAPFTDGSAHRVSTRYDGHSKIVGDYLGGYVGMLKVVADLGDKVDEVAGAKKWVTGKP